MNYVFKGSDRVFHILSVFCQLLGHLNDLRQAFWLGCFRGDEWYGFKISDFTIDL